MAKRKVVKKKIDNSIKRYTCPKCEGGFNPPDLKDKKCPHCSIALKAERHVKTDGTKGFYYIYAPDNVSGNVVPARQPVVIAEDPPRPGKPDEPQEPGVKITRDGEVPQVWRTGDGEIEEDGTRRKATYLAIYQGVIHAGWVLCPQCSKPLYQNQIVNTGGGHAEVHSCRNGLCKATTRFIFQANMRMGFRMGG